MTKQAKLVMTLMLAVLGVLALPQLLAGGQTLIMPGVSTSSVTFHVAPSCSSAPSPCYTTLQLAMNAAFGGETILVAEGTYTDTSTYGGLTQVVYISKDIIIRGGYTADFVDPPDPESNATVLDAEGKGRVIYVTGPASVTIEGVSITGGDATGLEGSMWGEDAGGGVYCLNATLVLSNSRVYSNTANRNSWHEHDWGGGLYAWESTVALVNNSIISNTAGRGGGFMLNELPSGSESVVSGNTVTYNIAKARGGGFYIEATSLW